MPETQGRPWETFNNSESGCHTTMVLQMKVEAVNFSKSQEISLLWLDCFITKFWNKWSWGANRSPPGPNRINLSRKTLQTNFWHSNGLVRFHCGRQPSHGRCWKKSPVDIPLATKNMETLSKWHLRHNPQKLDWRFFGSFKHYWKLDQIWNRKRRRPQTSFFRHWCDEINMAISPYQSTENQPAATII